MNESLLDTDMLSEIMKGKNYHVAQRMKEYMAAYGRLTISSLTIMEIVKGFEKTGRIGQLEQTMRFIDAQRLLSFDTPSARIAGRIFADLERMGRSIGGIDPMIAAVAIQHGLALATGIPGITTVSASWVIL